MLAFQRGEDTEQGYLGGIMVAENHAVLRLIAQALTGLKDL